MKIIQNPLIAILIFSIYPIVFLYSHNINEVYLVNVVGPLVLSITMSLVLFGLFAKWFNSTNKASFPTLTLLFIFYSYGAVLDFINERLWTAVFSIVLIIAAGYLIYKKKIKISNTIEYVNFVSIVLLIILLFNLLSQAPSIQVRQNQLGNDKSNGKIEVEDGNLPDIYYIIPDRYANQAVLKDDFGFDNSQFINYLENKGFFINHSSFANYPKTHLSMASFLNMTYLDDLAARVGKESEDKKPAFDMVQDNFAQEYLRKKGYQFIYFGGWWGPTQQNRHAERNYNLYGQSSDFVRQLSATTLLNAISDTPIARYFPVIASGDQMKRQNIQYQFNQLQQVTQENSGKPKFVIAHLFIPHYPYLLDSSCQPKKFTEDVDEDGQYLEQLKCANIFLTQTIDAILRYSNKPPIIILQSDEGPFKFDEMYRNGENDIDWTKVSDKGIRHHMLIMNAIYLPEETNISDTSVASEVYQGMSPVNTLRVIFNRYFGESYPLLPDKAFFIPHLDKSYDYFEVTDKLKKN